MSDLSERTTEQEYIGGMSEEMMNRLGIYSFRYYVNEDLLICSDNLVKKYGVMPRYEKNVYVFVEDLLVEENVAFSLAFFDSAKEGSDQTALFMSRIGRDVLKISLFVMKKNASGRAVLLEGVVENVSNSILMERENKVQQKNDVKMLNVAIKHIYHIGISMNITRNEYHLVSFVEATDEMPSVVGTIDELHKRGLGYIPDSAEKELFDKLFSRKALLRAYAAGEKEVVLEHKHIIEDGSVHWAESRVIFIEGGNGDACAISLITDIDEKKAQEKAMREQLEIVDALSRDYLNVYIVDLKKNRLRVVKSSTSDDTGEKEYVYSKILKKYVEMMVHPDDVQDVLQQLSIDFMKMSFKHSDEYVSSCKVIRNKEVHYYQYKFVRPSQTNKNIAIIAFQNIDNMVVKETKMNEELRKAIADAQAANEAKSTFFFNMSHDIRTPMNAILGYANLLKQTEGSSDIQKKYIDNICVSGKYLLELINGVLEMSRIESGNLSFDVQCMSMNDLAKSIKSILNEEYKKKKLTVERSFEFTHPYVFADFTKCQEIALNILSNAIKYTPEGGKITISCKELPHSYDGFAYYMTEITDTGIGISPEYLPHIFERFSREQTYTENKIAGTGLGMGITKKIIEGMGGTISVESELGKGTRVSYTIPFQIAGEAEIAKEKIDLSLTYTGETKRILLAEDNELNSDIAKALLESRGFEVELAWDGMECFEMIDDHDDDYYDLILMDIQMPRMDGYQTAQRIRNMYNKKKAMIPIIAMTANVFDEDRKRAFDSGMNGFTGKPIEVQLLFGEIGRILHNEE